MAAGSAKANPIGLVVENIAFSRRLRLTNEFRITTFPGLTAIRLPGIRVADVAS